MRVVVLTGAGISAESGLATFRDEGGVWSQYDLNDVATPEGFARDPARVHAFYNLRRREMQSATPNAAHVALARLKAALGDTAMIVTQNVDDLHERAGLSDVIHMHGELLRASCTACFEAGPWRGDLSLEAACPHCGATGSMRPDVVWFGEIPRQMDEIVDAVARCDVFAAIGTSGEVYPAAGFVDIARAAGAKCLEFNLKPTGGPFDERRTGPAATTTPGWVEEVLRDAR